MEYQQLVKRGYKQAAFRNKSNAQKFAAAWRGKGYRTETIRSSGPVVEGGYKEYAYYVIARGKIRKRRKIKRKKQPQGPFGLNFRF